MGNFRGGYAIYSHLWWWLVGLAIGSNLRINVFGSSTSCKSSLAFTYFSNEVIIEYSTDFNLASSFKLFNSAKNIQLSIQRCGRESSVMWPHWMIYCSGIPPTTSSKPTIAINEPTSLRIIIKDRYSSMTRQRWEESTIRRRTLLLIMYYDYDTRCG